MTGRSHSTDPADQVAPLCRLCDVPRPSHTHWCPLRPASWTVSQAAHLDVYRVGAALETLLPPLPAVGSSSIRRGGVGSRSWSATGSSGSVCRRLRRGRSVSTWEAIRSQRGMATGRTSDSSRSSSAVDVSIGTAAPTLAELREMALPEFEEIVRRAPKWGASDRVAGETPVADCDKGHKGNHLWGYWGFADDGLVCVNCGRRK